VNFTKVHFIDQTSHTFDGASSALPPEKMEIGCQKVL